jgi:two-component system, cell cycle response regulator DivK
MTKVLVIEDNADNLKIISYALRRAGYAVISAERGEEGIELALRESPMFIIMDINLPGIDGVETTRRIRASEADGRIPIVAITSYALAGDRERFLAAGCDGYIEKPVDPITLVERLHDIIRPGKERP